MKKNKKYINQPATMITGADFGQPVIEAGWQFWSTSYPSCDY
jgi:hypothetical protein